MRFIHDLVIRSEEEVSQPVVVGEVHCERFKQNHLIEVLCCWQGGRNNVFQSKLCLPSRPDRSFIFAVHEITSASVLALLSNLAVVATCSILIIT